MPWVFNPFTGKLDQTGSGGGSGTQVNSDWSATSGVEQILNKPSLSAVATSGSASDLTTGTLADARLSSNVSLDNQNNNFTAGQSITAAANTSALTASYSVTGTNTTPLLDLTGTWNTTGLARGIRLNVTDTASANFSLLMDLQVGGSSRFSVDKTGVLSPTSINMNGWTLLNSSGQINIGTSGFVGFTSGTGASTVDTIIRRDAANTLALRNGGTAGTPVPQNFRIYNYTDAGLTNFERGFLRWNSNTLEIGTEAGGTGTARATRISSASFAEINVPTGAYFNININNINRFGVGGTGNISYSNLIINSGSNLRLAGSVTPASATATGTTGDIQRDADFIYVCTATNTWKRAALSTW